MSKVKNTQDVVTQCLKVNVDHLFCSRNKLQCKKSKYNCITYQMY